jgi:hypothetical protein
VTPEQVARLQHQVGIAAGTFPERLAATGPNAQALYRALLPALAATGAPPPLADAAAKARLTPDLVRAALSELATADLVTLDEDGIVAGVFPLSARPTRHRVQLQNGPVLHAMCAVDALGVPAMLGEAAVVSSTDPVTGEPVQVTINHEGRLDVESPAAVVLLARAGDGPLAGACCSVIDFYADAATARRALDQPGTRGTVLSLADAHALAAALFADLPAHPSADQGIPSAARGAPPGP